MRPWGPLEWLLNKLPTETRGKAFRVLGGVGSEERCKAIPALCAKRGYSGIVLVNVVDPPSRFSAEIAQKTAAHVAEIEETLRGPLMVTRADLLCGDEVIVGCLDAALGGTSDPLELWLDISCLPKRFFFLLIKLAMRSPQVETLVVTYTQPAAGGYTEEHLAEDPEPVTPLPGYGPVAQDPERLVVAVGFEALGLPQLLSEYRDRRREIEILMPFPPGQPYSRRIWDTIRSVGHAGDASAIRRVSAIDAFAAYDELRFGGGGRMPAEAAPPALAPYGPKPLSLGMCLYALRHDAPVFYTQPKLYHPKYTQGIGSMWGYCVKVKGRPVFDEL